MYQKIQLTCYITVVLIIICNIRSCQASSNQCICGGFIDSDNLNELIIQRALPFDVQCNEIGAEDCRNKCNTLTRSIPEHIANNHLCQHLYTGKIPKMSLYAKNCDTGSWTFANYRTSEAICCDEGVPVSCTSE